MSSPNHSGSNVLVENEMLASTASGDEMAELEFGDRPRRSFPAGARNSHFFVGTIRVPYSH